MFFRGTNMQLTLSNLVKKQVEILLFEYKNSYAGEDLRNQLFMAGIDLDVPAEGHIKGFGDLYNKRNAVKYIFNELSSDQVLNYISKFYINVMFETSSKYSFLMALNEILSGDSIKLREDGSIISQNIEQKNLSVQTKEALNNSNKLSAKSPKNIPEHNEATIATMDKIMSEKNKSNQIHKDATIKQKDKKEIFIVHGHDNEMKESVARLIEKFNLKPIILHEQANRGKTIIEKFQGHSENVACAIVLLSPDDKGCKANEPPESLKYRARQNVILEMGYLIGQLGRDKVFVLAKESNNLEIPSDILGILHIAYESDWKVNLSKELQDCGLNIDLNKMLY
jgi:predicted nucleotide-binding protein